MACVNCGAKAFWAKVPGVETCPSCTTEFAGLGEVFVVTEALRNSTTGQVYSVGSNLPVDVANDPDVVPISQMPGR